MAHQRTIVVTGSASGMGAATLKRLVANGDRVIGVDLHDADVIADLGTPEGRQSAVEAITELSQGVLDGLVTFAGKGGLPNRAGSLLVAVNYFGTVKLLENLRPLLAKGTNAAAIAIASNSMTCQPGVPLDVVKHCLDSDEEGARVAADTAGSIQTYPATKLAVTRWVRHHATSAGAA